MDFFGPFSLERIGGKNPPNNPRQFSNQNLGVSGPKSTLQGSGLEKLLSAILGPEMAARILWAPGKMRSSAGKTHVRKIPPFRGGGFWGGGGGSADFIFMGARIFLMKIQVKFAISLENFNLA